jgi:hypothetical protein
MKQREMLNLYLNAKPSKKKYLYGLGLFDYFKSIGSKLTSLLSTDLFKNIGKKAFQLAMNEYRKRFCGGRSRPLELGELHYGCHNYSGPGTVLNDKTRDFKAYNDIDNCSRLHDIVYDRLEKSKMSKEKKALEIRKADEEALSCYNKYPNEDGFKLARLGIQGKLTAEKILSEIKGKPTTFYGGINCKS